MSEEEKKTAAQAAKHIKENAEPAEESRETQAKPEKASPEKPETNDVKKDAGKAEGSKEEKKVKESKPDPKDAEITNLQTQIKDLNDQVAKLKNAYAMAYADTENTRKRLNNEFDQHMKYHIQEFAREILPVIDNCQRALAVKPKDTEDENYRKAFEMVLNSLLNALKKEGVEVIDCKGKDFDPNWMQAVMSEHADGVKSGQVLEVFQDGYKLKDRLLRAAMVKVSE